MCLQIHYVGPCTISRHEFSSDNCFIAGGCLVTLVVFQHLQLFSSSQSPVWEDCSETRAKAYWMQKTRTLLKSRNIGLFATQEVSSSIWGRVSSEEVVHMCLRAGLHNIFIYISNSIFRRFVKKICSDNIMHNKQPKLGKEWALQIDWINTESMQTYHLRFL